MRDVDFKVLVLFVLVAIAGALVGIFLPSFLLV